MAPRFGVRGYSTEVIIQWRIRKRKGSVQKGPNVEHLSIIAMDFGEN